MRYQLLLWALVSILVLASCHKNDMDKDASDFADLKCQLKGIDVRYQSGELNFIETEDEKEPIFEEMDVLRRRYRLERQAFDSLIGIKVDAVDCQYN